MRDKFELNTDILTACNRCESLKDIGSKEFQNVSELWMHVKSVEEDVDNKLISFTDLNEQQMQLLHDYNDMKDLTQCVFGRLATILDVSVSQVHKKFDLYDEYGRAEYIVQEASRLTEIFEIAHPYMILEVASMALHEENGELAVELLRYLVDSVSIDQKLCTKLLDFVGEHIFNLAKYMCNTSKPFEIASLLKTVSSMCLESASVSTILQAVEISIWVNLITGCRPQVSFFSEYIPSTRLFQFLPEMVTSILKEYASFAGEFRY
ncbi:uncharacterized protein LOC111057209 isoform X3 [Nilaparvata lugens]|uniref:uncharacterized protein LOC111057209 isoform X3 n=1 Tax=Nilaparvata lugens TaxID=108931 RepID=UPI00193E2BC0|nr:uncharacterized protein LOC111057209 isoform X3 [Nilaparvata lugens]